MASPRRPSAAPPNGSNWPNRLNRSNTPPRTADGFEATITALRPAAGHERAELIRDVIDAFGRLRDSLCRLNRLFAPDADCARTDTSLLPLLVTLALHGENAGCRRPRELKRAIRDARQLDRTRDALFSDAFCRDHQAMRHTLAELERLDALFVGLGVEHVLAQHERIATGIGPGERPHRSRAAARPHAGKPEAPRHAGALIGETAE